MRIKTHLLFAVFAAAAGARGAAAAPSTEAPLLFLKGMLHERSGDPQAALAEYEELLRLDPDNRFLHETVAFLALRLQRLDLALSQAEAVVRLAPTDVRSHLTLGRVRLARSESPEAAAAFEKALALDPSHFEALLYAAHLKALTDPQGAAALYQRYLAENPGSVEVRAKLGELQQGLGRLDEALATWKKVVESDPGDVNALLSLTQIYEIRSDTAPLAALYENVRALDPSNVQVLLRLGELYHRSGAMGKALDAFQEAERLRPGDATVSFYLALQAEERGDWAEAARRMTQAAAVGAEPSILLRLAYYHGQSGRPDESIRVIRRLVEARPDNADFHYYLAMAYADAGRRRPAAACLRRVLALDPVRADAHFHLAAHLDALGRFRQAEPHLLKAVALNPDHAVALNYLGYSWADRGKRLEEALGLIERALVLDPDNGAYLDSLGWAYYKLGRLEEARSALADAARDEQDPLVWRHYGDVLMALDKKEDARLAWQEAWFIDPRDPELRARLRTLSPTDRVVPRSGPRALLKRVEVNFRQIKTLAGFMGLDARIGPVSWKGDGLFYYASPDRFRFELLGPFFAPEVLVVRNADGLEWRPAARAWGDPAVAGRWLALPAEALSGDIFGRFDHPDVRVTHKAGRFTYRRAGLGELEIDGAAKVLTAVSWPASRAEGRPALRLRFDGYREDEGIRLPSALRCEAGGRAFIVLDFKRLKVNTSLAPALFRPSE